MLPFYSILSVHQWSQKVSVQIRLYAVFQSGLFFETAGTHVCTVGKKEVLTESCIEKEGIITEIEKSERGHTI